MSGILDKPTVVGRDHTHAYVVQIRMLSNGEPVSDWFDNSAPLWSGAIKRDAVRKYDEVREFLRSDMYDVRLISRETDTTDTLEDTDD